MLHIMFPLLRAMLLPHCYRASPFQRSARKARLCAVFERPLASALGLFHSLGVIVALPNTLCALGIVWAASFWNSLMNSSESMSRSQTQSNNCLRLIHALWRMTRHLRLVVFRFGCQAPAAYVAPACMFNGQIDSCVSLPGLARLQHVAIRVPSCCSVLGRAIWGHWGIGLRTLGLFFPLLRLASGFVSPRIHLAVGAFMIGFHASLKDRPLPGSHKYRPADRAPSLPDYMNDKIGPMGPRTISPFLRGTSTMGTRRP